MRETAKIGAHSGFSLMELLTAITVVAIIAVIAVPSLSSWRQNSEYRKTARELASIYREARSRAITNNLQYRVELSSDTTPTAYRLSEGNRAEKSGTFTPIAPFAEWQSFYSSVTISASTSSVDFDPLGRANSDVVMEIKDKGGSTRFVVSVTATGRIAVK